jgi:alpha-L-fucosidase
MASIEAFFTTKSQDVYAILPRWPGRRFTLKDAAGLEPRAVTLLGEGSPLRFSKAGTTIEVTLPDLPEDLLGQPAWVLKFAR